MSHPYAVRPRTRPHSPISFRQLFRTFEEAPKLGTPHVNAYQANRQQSKGLPTSSQLSTAQTKKVKAFSACKLASEKEISNVDIHSNSFNESSLAVEKFRRSDGDFERVEQNPHSLDQDQSFLFAHNSSERELSQQAYHPRNRDRLNKVWTCSAVPYRKCHSTMEEKVVTVINKIKSGKDCQKEIETLMEKSKKVSIKELHNRYFVSGIQLISNLSEDCKYLHAFTPDLVRKISEGLQDLKTRIVADMDNTRGFETRSDLEAACFCKLELVRRAYRILRKKLRTQKRQEVQSKALEAADWFINNNVNNLSLFYGELTQC